MRGRVDTQIEGTVMNNKNETLRSHVIDSALGKAVESGRSRGKKGVAKNRFLHPYVVLDSKDGKSFRSGKWKCGHRHNPNSR